MKYSVTLEHGSDGSYLAWVHELPGCFARGKSRQEVEEVLPATIREFLTWLENSGEPPPGDAIEVAIVDEVESIIQAAEDTEVLLDPDRAPLDRQEWNRIHRWLGRSRADLLEAFSRIPADRLEEKSEGSSRTLRGELMHIAFVELMYAAWTFELNSKDGLRDFLDWTRCVAVARMAVLAERGDSAVTHAEWAGAPRLEGWTARKAARRLIWHELLHLPSLQRAAESPENQPPV